MGVSNPEAPKYKHVAVDHPSVVSTIRNLAKQGKSKEDAQRIVGMPREVIDRHYKEEGK